MNRSPGCRYVTRWSSARASCSRVLASTALKPRRSCSRTRSGAGLQIDGYTVIAGLAIAAVHNLAHLTARSAAARRTNPVRCDERSTTPARRGIVLLLEHAGPVSTWARLTRSDQQHVPRRAAAPAAAYCRGSVGGFEYRAPGQPIDARHRRSPKEPAREPTLARPARLGRRASGQRRSRCWLVGSIDAPIEAVGSYGRNPGARLSLRAGLRLSRVSHGRPPGSSRPSYPPGASRAASRWYLLGYRFMRLSESAPIPGYSLPWTVKLGTVLQVGRRMVPAVRLVPGVAGNRAGGPGFSLCGMVAGFAW
jgi:hypothetical protein